MWKKMGLMLVVMTVIFGGLAGYHLFGNFMMKQYFATRKAPPVTVSTDKVASRVWQDHVRGIGDVRAFQGMDISAEVAGIVAMVGFSSGDEVKEGQELLRLNADADMAQLNALKAAADLARIVSDRNKKQFEVQAVSQAVIDADDAELKSRQAQVAGQEALLAKKVIRASFTGKLGISSVSVGQYLNPGEKIVSLQAIDPVRVDFFLPQQQLARVRVGQEVTVSSDVAPGRLFKGKISAVNATIDRASRNIQFEATVANADKALVPGMFVDLEIEAGSPQKVLTVPQTAVAFNPYGETVYVVEDGGKDEAGKSLLTVRQTFITTGNTRGDLVVVTSGLKEGDLIVSSGQHKLRNGSTIIVNNKVQPSQDEDPKPVDM